MVKKLFKYEISYYIRKLPIYFLIVIFMAAILRFVQFFENDSYSYETLRDSSVIIFVVSIVLCILMTVIAAVSRFHKNLFTNEGYLTLTLPVTAGQHIWVKLLTAALFIVVALVVSLIGAIVATLGDLGIEIFKVIKYVAVEGIKEDGMYFWLLLVENLIFFIVSTLSNMLLFYFCISLGQLFSKKRTTKAVLIYLGYLLLTFIYDTFVSIVNSQHSDPEQEYMNSVYFGNQSVGLFDGFSNQSPHILIWEEILVQAILGAIFFAVTHFVVKKKVNLE